MTYPRWVVGSLAVLLCACPGWSERAGHLDGVTVMEDVAYVPAPAHEAQAVDFYLPSGAGPRPMALFVHGGLWSAQGRRMFQWLTGLYGASGLALARAGFTAGVVGYRQHPTVTAKGSLEDLARAVAWAQQNAARVGGDPKCVVLVGHSAGALFVSHLALDPQHLKAAGGDPAGIVGAVLLGGLHVVEPVLPELKPDQVAGVHALFGATPEARTAWNPTLLAEKGGAVPLLLLGGSKDSPSLLAQQKSMHQVLTDHGANVTAQVLDAQDHMDLTPSRGHDAVNKVLTPWLAQVTARCAQAQ